MKTTLLVLLAALLAACASKPPPAIAKIPPQDLSLTQVRIDIDRYLGSEVRWGGIISKVENKTDRTWIEIVRHELGADGRPLTGGKSDGRFVASFGKFVDPLVYETGRSLTVVGAIEAKTSRPIGEFEYQFPIVAVEGSFLSCCGSLSAAVLLLQPLALSFLASLPASPQKKPPFGSRS